MNRKKQLWIVLLLAILPVMACATQQQAQVTESTVTESSITGPITGPADPVRRVQEAIDNAKLNFEFEDNFGYIRSVLTALNVPVSSQGFVFGRNSAQLDLISPERPRTVYFNDDVYVGYVQAGSFIEIAAMDPKLGPVFWTL